MKVHDSVVEICPPVMKVVSTPDGPQQVIMDHAEYLRQAVQQAHANFVRSAEDEVFCRRCNKEASQRLVAHYCARFSNSAWLIPVDDAPLDHVLYMDVLYCMECDPVPESPGFPIVVPDSYYNRPH